MKIKRETLYDPETCVFTYITTYIAETLSEYRVCKSSITKNHFKFLCCLGDEDNVDTSLNVRFSNVYNDNYDNKKCFVDLYLIQKDD